MAMRTNRCLSSLSGRGLLVAAACMALGAGATGCGNSPNGVAARTPGSVASAVTKGATSTLTPGPNDGTPSASEHQKLPKGASTAIPMDPLASKSLAPVERSGKAAHPSVRTVGGVKPFTQSVKYADGLQLTITKMTQGKVTGQGPGVFPGRAVTDFYVTLTNGTKKTLSLDVVVVTVTYGTPARLAHFVYDGNSVDFAGTIKPGKSGKAVYGFSVPAADLSNVTMTADLDGIHQLAVFKGKVT